MGSGCPAALNLLDVSGCAGNKSQAASPQQREQSPQGGQAACISVVPGTAFFFFLKSSASGLTETQLSLKEELPDFQLLQPELS